MLLREVQKIEKLVFLESLHLSAEPFTTSEIVAEYAQIDHHAIQQLVRRHRADFEAFGVIAFQMRKPPAGSKGGRPVKVYRLNESQATLLVTYLQNTVPVRRFKAALVKEFFAMRTELNERKINRQTIKPSTRSLTDAIRDNLPTESVKPYTYANFVGLAYKAVLGLSVKQLRHDRLIPKESPIVDYLSAAELEQIKKIENVIAALLDAGLTYHGIKAMLGVQTELLEVQRAG